MIQWNSTLRTNKKWS